MKTLYSMTHDAINTKINEDRTKMVEGFSRLGVLTEIDPPEMVETLICPDCGKNYMMTCYNNTGWIEQRKKLVAVCVSAPCIALAKFKKPKSSTPVQIDWKIHGIHPAYEDKTINNLRDMPSSVSGAMDFITSGKSCLTLTGESGTGKTHLAIATLKEFHLRTGKSAVFVHISDFLDQLRECQASNTNEYRVINQFASYSLLVIDDLGSTRGTDWQIEKTRELIQKRIGTTKTIITTNYTMDELQGTYGVIFMRRLSESSQAIPFKRRVK